MAERAATILNGVNPEQTKAIFAKLDKIDERQHSLLGSYRADKKVILADEKQIYGDAETQGFNAKALKAARRQYKLERLAREVKAGLDLDEQSQLSMIRDALGDYVSTPLGEAALAAAAE